MLKLKVNGLSFAIGGKRLRLEILHGDVCETDIKGWQTCVFYVYFFAKMDASQQNEAAYFL